MPAAALMKMFWTWFCVLVALPLGTTAIKTKSEIPVSRSQRSSVALLGNIPLPTQDPEYVALKGSGGGLDALEAKTKGDDKLYRHWKTRFDLQPYDANSADFLFKSENRLGYRHFYAAHPNLALVPNSRDRQAQTTVEIMFGLTALATIFCGIVILNRFAVFEAEDLDSKSYQKLMVRIILFAAAPWLVLGAWLLTLALAGIVNPMRDSQLSFHWQCNAMAWFLLVAPLVNTAYFSVHALWISKLFFNIESQSNGSMGRMFSMSNQKQALLENGDNQMLVLNHATSGVSRYALLIMEVACLVFGYILITFRWGANSQLCQPEVYWATTALVMAVAIIIAFTALTFVSSIFIRVYSTSPWLQDFFGSFREVRLLAKMKTDEEADVKEHSEWKAWKAHEPRSGFEEDLNEWQAIQEGFAEDHKNWNAAMMEHAAYLEKVKQPHPKHPREKDKPLVVWDDDDEDEEVLEKPTGVPQIQYDSLAPLSTSAQVTSSQPWLSSVGFAAPFAPRPYSSPVLGSSSQRLFPDSFLIPSTASTIYTAPPNNDRVWTPR